ncbi:putative dynactin Arp1 p25 subunit RO12 [Jaminaea rosea]|uniref:Dynactin subunit 5 n=1 Tax=Jaminaea rosea TaxID=1569628 RepID=A0A316UVK3_9BASI|nr:putative dynactin Arp1 p25 subunit RO12 [Jaminaea rosea]PWN29330.1 putative dynactin Arp1 p25 subunit RO12 [Jaminaea rosea]
MDTSTNEGVKPYPPNEYIQTSHTLNRVSRKAVLHGTSNIVLGGKCIIHSGAMVRGDLKRAASGSTIAISTGRYCVVGEGTVLRPPYKTYKGTFSYYPVKLGDFVHIGSSSVLQATSVGSHIDIGRDCIIGRFVTVKDCVRICDGSVVAPYTTIPSGQVWAGNPAKKVGSLPETWAELHEARGRDYYGRFRPATLS